MGIALTQTVSFYVDQGSSEALEAHQHGSLTGQFAIKGRQGDGKGLQGTHGETVIHGEDVLRYTAELHYYVIVWKKTPAGGKKERWQMT